MSDIRYARTRDGVSLAYRVDGDGPIDIVFVPGFAAFARLIAFDRRGQQPLKGVPGEWRIYAVG